MTHLGQQLSALIDGELDVSERERVLVHMTKCRSCQDETAALRMLKRRMNALGEAAAGAAGAGLTGRLMGLSSGRGVGTMWPPATGSWSSDGYDGEPAAGYGSQPAGYVSRETKSGRYFLAGSLAVFLAGLGTAAFIAGGEPQAQAPAPPVRPSVDVQLSSRELNGTPAAPDSRVRPESLGPVQPLPGGPR